MVDERAIRRIEELLTEVTRLGGRNESTSIVPNLTVVDAAPAGLTNFITVSDERDGDTILAKTVPGVIYAVSDKVNVLFVEGTEPIAYQQGSESLNAGLWEIVPDTSTDIFYDKGRVGIGTSTPTVTLDATANINTSTGIQAKILNTSTAVNSIALLTMQADNATVIGKTEADGLGTGPAGTASFNIGTFSSHPTTLLSSNTVAATIDTSQNIGIGTSGPDAKLDILATTTQLRLTHTDGSKFVDLTLDTNHDLTVTPSSTGQVIFQPTTDSTDFFQVLDADGGTPIVNVDSTNERVGVGIATPDNTLHVHKATSGAVASIVNAPLVVENSTSCFINLLAPDANERGILFGDVSSNVDGGIVYSSSHAMQFRTNPNSTKMTLNANGSLAIGIAAASGKLHVDQASTTAAIPVALFDQADVSEEFLKFIGTAAAATLTQSLVDEGDVTTATRIGFFKIDVDDVGNQITDGAYFVPFFSLA